MTIRIRFGPINGTLERVTLQATVYRDDFALLTETDAKDALLAGLPATVLGYSTELKDITIKERCKFGYSFEVVYISGETADNQPPTPPATGTVVRNVASRAGSVKLSTFLEPVGVYNDGSGTDVSTDYKYLKWRIDHASQGSHYSRSQERTFDPLRETHHRSYYPTAALVTEARLNVIEALLGSFNHATYLTRPAGSLQLVRFEAAPRNRHDWELQFGYAYWPEKTNLYVSNDGGGTAVKIPTLRGCDYYFTKDEQHYDATAKRLQLKTKFAVVGRVWPLGDFTTTGIDATGTPTWT